MRPIPLAYLPDRLPWRKWTGADEFGTPTYAAQVILKCRLELRAKLIMNNQGQLVMTRGLIIIGGDNIPMIDPKDELLMPPTVEEPLGEPAVVLEASLLKDQHGNVHHAEVILG